MVTPYSESDNLAGPVSPFLPSPMAWDGTEHIVQNTDHSVRLTRIEGKIRYG